jgi:hypothetical protein
MMANVVTSQNKKKTPRSDRLDVSNSENLKIWNYLKKNLIVRYKLCDIISYNWK